MAVVLFFLRVIYFEKNRYVGRMISVFITDSLTSMAG